MRAVGAVVRPLVAGRCGLPFDDGLGMEATDAVPESPLHRRVHRAVGSVRRATGPRIALQCR